MQPDSIATQTPTSSLTDIIVKLHADQTLLEEQHSKTQEKLTVMIRQLDKTDLTIEQLTALQTEYNSAIAEFDQALKGINDRLQKILTENAL